MSDLRVLILFYMVEGALVGFVGTRLIGLRLNPKQYALIGILQGLVVWLVRGFYTINNIPFGTHTLLNLLGLITIIFFVARKGWGVSAVAGLLGFMIVILSESMMLPSVYEFLSVTMEKVFSDVWLHIAIGYVGDLFLIAVALFLFVTKKALVDLTDFGSRFDNWR